MAAHLPRCRVPRRYKDGTDSPTEDGEKPRVLSPEFTADADARVAITVYCQAVEGSS